MIEAVGHEHLVSFFQCIGRQLKQGGVAVIQVTTGVLLTNQGVIIGEHMTQGGSALEAAFHLGH